MNGMFKVLGLTVPAVAIIILLTYHQQREHIAKMDTDSAAFDRDFAQSRASLAKSPEEKAIYQKQAKAAQSDYSSSRSETAEKKKTVEHLGGEMDRAANDVDRQIKSGGLQKALKEGK
jgi:hypothetical protein